MIGNLLILVSNLPTLNSFRAGLRSRKTSYQTEHRVGRKYIILQRDSMAPNDGWIVLKRGQQSFSIS